jgi:hypothetical protein
MSHVVCFNAFSDHLLSNDFRHDSTGFFQPFLYFLYSHFSDGLTAGLQWEKDNCFTLLCVILCCISLQILLSVAFLLVRRQVAGIVGMKRFHFIWVVSLHRYFVFLSFVCRE